jgi:hypothetical protein
MPDMFEYRHIYRLIKVEMTMLKKSIFPRRLSIMKKWLILGLRNFLELVGLAFTRKPHPIV